MPACRGSLSSASALDPGPAGGDLLRVQAIEASTKLQASLREEQSLLVQRMVVMQQRLLSPRQVMPARTAAARRA